MEYFERKCLVHAQNSYLGNEIYLSIGIEVFFCKLPTATDYDCNFVYAITMKQQGRFKIEHRKGIWLKNFFSSIINQNKSPK